MYSGSTYQRSLHSGAALTSPPSSQIDSTFGRESALDLSLGGTEAFRQCSRRGRYENAAGPSTARRRGLLTPEIARINAPDSPGTNGASPLSLSPEFDPTLITYTGKGKQRARTPASPSSDAPFPSRAASQHVAKPSLPESNGREQFLADSPTSRKRPSMNGTPKAAKRLMTAIPSFLRSLYQSPASEVEATDTQQDRSSDIRSHVSASESSSHNPGGDETVAVLRAVEGPMEATSTTRSFPATGASDQDQVPSFDAPGSIHGDKVDPRDRSTAANPNASSSPATEHTRHSLPGVDEGYNSETPSTVIKSSPVRNRLANRLNAVHHELDLDHVRDGLKHLHDRMGHATNSIHWHINAKEHRVNRMMQGVHENLAMGFGRLHQELFDAHSGAAQQVSAVNDNITTLTDKVSDVHGTVAVIGQKLDGLRQGHTGADLDAIALASSEDIKVIKDRVTEVTSFCNGLPGMTTQLESLSAQIRTVLAASSEHIPLAHTTGVENNTDTSRSPITCEDEDIQALRESNREAATLAKVQTAHIERQALALREEKRKRDRVFRSLHQWASGTITNERLLEAWNDVAKGRDSRFGSYGYENEDQAAGAEELEENMTGRDGAKEQEEDVWNKHGARVDE